MNLLVQDLLTYSKLKDSPDEPFRNLSFDNVVKAVLNNLDNQVRSNEVELYFKNLPSTVYGIEVMLVQLFHNLILELHSGDIWLESKVGEGTVFHFSIPKGKDVEELEEIVDGESDTQLL